MDAEHSRRVLATLLPLFLLHFAVHAQVNNYIVGPQDVLAITLFDQQDLSGKYTVEADGTFTFPLIGRVKAGGMSLRDVEQALRTQLSDGFFKFPWPIFMDVGRTLDWTMVRHNALAVGWEAVFLGALLVLCWRRREHSRR